MKKPTVKWVFSGTRKKNQAKIDWEMLSQNPNAIHILEQNIDKIDVKAISGQLFLLEFGM